MVPLIVGIMLLVASHQNAQILQWDDNAHTDFSLIIDHNMSETIVINEITYNSDTYQLVDPILINRTNSLLTTIQAFMSFEDPIDDIKQAANDFTDYRVKQYDYQSITKAKAGSLLTLVHNGTLEYNRDSTYKHVLIDGTLETVKMKNYPITTACPGSCVNPDQNNFSPTYGGVTCNEDCVVYLCEYNGERWGAGSCDPLAKDDNVTDIESQHEAWYAIIEGSSISYRIRLAWGYGDTTEANKVYPNRWSLKYFDASGNELDKTCAGSTVYWDNGHYNGELYSPIANFGNEYRKVAYSLKNISVLSQPSIPITIGSHSMTHSTTEGAAIKQAIFDKFSYQRVIVDDIGYHNYTTTGSLSNSSNWLFINETYFGFSCNQIMIDQMTWKNATCGECMDRVLSTWSLSGYGITTLPYYTDLDLSNGVEQAAEVVTNLTSHSENDIAINFNYIFPTASISLSSTNFAFKQPNVCNAVSKVYTLISTKSTNVSFTNCGDISADFTYTINCANDYTSTTFSSITVAVNGVLSTWTAEVTNSYCNSVSSITISTTTCPEFWNSTCIWSTAMTTLTPEPTLSPTDDPTVSPTPLPTLNPTVPPTPFPTVNPTLSPSAAPVSFFESCTAYQVVPVRGAIQNTIVHQELCVPSVKGHYIVDINAKKPYYIAIDSATVSNTTINKINEYNYDIGVDSGVPATGSALIGHSMIAIETWYDVLAHLELDLSTYEPSQPIHTSIKIDGLSVSTDIPSGYMQDVFKSHLHSQLVSALEIEDSNQITINGARQGSIIADITITSSTISMQTPLQLSVALQNYVASNEATFASIASPLNSVNNYFYANQTNYIVFTNCPYRITATAWEGETVIVSWDAPSIKTRVNDNDILVFQAIGENSGESFSAGSYFIRYVALSLSNTSITPKYCSFVIAVDEKEWMLEFMGVEFSITTVIIIGTVLFCVCTGSIACSVRSRCKSQENETTTKQVLGAQQGNFKAVIVSHDSNMNVASPRFQIQENQHIY